MELYTITLYLYSGEPLESMEKLAESQGFYGTIKLEKAPITEGINDPPSANYATYKQIEAEDQEMAWEKARKSAVDVAHCIFTGYKVEAVKPAAPKA